ncbi:hypothetical protein [Rhizobium laguerreae]|uniref:hypothetical protein n=1 Tax=Rhizobium laguerreae TaxID=1076926 RepID=UPI001C918F37|nr:hypothetical protein [Rhizobium laguerreae]MBY3252208.1 hypothetical protein [Rhizobium laguerreae]
MRPTARIPSSSSDQPPRKPAIRTGSRRLIAPVIAERHTHGGDRPLLTLQFASQGRDFRSPLEAEPLDVILKQLFVGARPPRPAPAVRAGFRLLGDRYAFGPARDLPVRSRWWRVSRRAASMRDRRTRGLTGLMD